MTALYDVVVKHRHIEGGDIAVMEFESATAQPYLKWKQAHILMYTCLMGWSVNIHCVRTRQSRVFFAWVY